MILPVATRELRTAARHRKLYQWRLRAGIVEAIAAAILFAFSGTGAGGGDAFWFLSGVALVFCLLDGLRKAADSISEEKREGTLGLLFLGSLRGSDVVLGKFTSAMVRSANGLLAFIPILAISLLLGGVTLAEFWRLVLVLFVTLIASTSLCLVVSAICREESAVSALLLLGAWCGLPPLLFGLPGRLLGKSFLQELANLSPVVLFRSSSEAAALFGTQPFWIGIAANALLGIASLALASFIVVRTWQDRPIRVRGQSAPREPHVRRPGRKRELLDVNPFFWLAFNERAHRIYLALVIGIVSLGMLAFIFCVFFLSWDADPDGTLMSFLLYPVFGATTLLGMIRTAGQASSTLVEARRSGFLELSIGTPVQPSQVMAGQWMALHKIIRPMAMIAALFGLVHIIGVAFGPASLPMGSLLVPLVSIAGAFLELYLLGWAGIWMALTSATPGRAFFKTLVIGFVLPYFSCACIPPLIPAILIFVARRKAHAILKNIFARSEGASLVPPLPAGTAPPVIRQPLKNF